MSQFRVGLYDNIVNPRFSAGTFMRWDYVTAVACGVDSFWVPDHLNSLLPWSIHHRDFEIAVHKCTDPETDGATLVHKPEAVRRRWFDSQMLAGQLNKILPIVVAGAELGGISVYDDTVLLPLTVDPGTAHRRRLWEAWSAGGPRTGRWGALCGLGAKIRAAELEGFLPYRLPKPLVGKKFSLGSPNSRGLYRTVVEDPEHAELEQQPVEELEAPKPA